MITYESLKELAQALSKVSGYRYVAFCKRTGKLDIYLSNSKMFWRSSKLSPPGFWFNELDYHILDLMDLSNLDWPECQFDCKEADNGI